MPLIEKSLVLKGLLSSAKWRDFYEVLFMNKRFCKELSVNEITCNYLNSAQGDRNQIESILLKYMN